MSYLHPLTRHPLPHPDTPFTFPFAYTPDPLAQEAALLLTRHLQSQPNLIADARNGKMFGVLICHDHNGNLGFLAAFSGTLDGQFSQPYFVPPLLTFDTPGSTFKVEEEAISHLNSLITQREADPHILSLRQQLADLTIHNTQTLNSLTATYNANRLQRQTLRTQRPELADQLNRQSQFEKAELKRQRTKLNEQATLITNQIATYDAYTNTLKAQRHHRSIVLQRWLFSHMKAHCADGSLISVRDIFLDAGKGIPPAGTGDCAAPKLLNFAFANNLHPISMAEFWIGNSPKGEIRIDGHFYPACNQKCRPLLSRMLRGFNVAPDPLSSSYSPTDIEILYEDQWLLAVNKPHGLITVSDNHSQPSLMSLIRSMRPISGPGYVHRLDMPTSGIVLIAKDKDTHHALQSLFESRQVTKSYIAMVEGHPDSPSGTISLPLIPNIDDRPRQMVDFIRGKEAITQYSLISSTPTTSLLLLHPLTGRTHQLRVHLASPLGLNCPIVGDNLYGHLGPRLMLHSNELSFTHPYTKKAVHIVCPANF